MADSIADIKSIFGKALVIESPTDRQVFLDEVCGEDPKLRAEVASLLEAHRARGGLFGDLEPSPDATTDAPAPDRPGSVIGPYKIVEQIGEGGMGTVWMALQNEPVKRVVALKLIKPGMDSKQVIARFEAERQALALMDHANIARVLDAGTTSAGRPYFVMDLVKGVPITRYCDEYHFTPRQRMELFIPVCQAIQHAHQKGIIHRDLKPSNVLVALYDGTPVPKVIDFGVAKAVGQHLTERTLITGFGAVVGTLEYMSPEQAEINQLDIDTRSDIYSLGVLLYELLAGSPPFTRKELEKAGMMEMLRVIREQEPSKPSTKLSTADGLPTLAANRGTEPAKLTKLVRGELDWIVMKALEKDRNRRYETANGFAMDVQRYLANEPVIAGPPGAAYRLRKFVRRNQGPVLAASVVLLALIVGVMGTTCGMLRAIDAEGATRAEANEKDKAKKAAEDEAAIAKAVVDFLQNDLLAQASPEWNPRDRKVTVEEVLRRAAARIGGKFAGQPQTEAAIRLAIGETYYLLGDYAAAQPHLERAWELRRQVLGEEHPDTLSTAHNLALVYQDQGQYSKALQLLLRDLEVSRRVRGPEHTDTLQTMNTLAALYHELNQTAEAEALYVQVLDIRGRVLGEAHRDTITSIRNLGTLYWSRGQIAKAEPLLLKALELCRRVHGDVHPETLTSMNNLASTYADQGEKVKAAQLFVEALAVSRRVLGEEHANTLGSMNNLATLYLEMSEFAKAEALLVQALETSRRVLGEEHRLPLTTTINLANVFRSQGRLAAADPLLVNALEVSRRLFGEEHATTLGIMNNLAANHNALGQFAKAEAMLRTCLAIREKKEPDEWTTFNTKSLLGAALLGQKKHTEAEPLLLAGYEGMRQREAAIPKPSSARLLEALEQVVQLYEAMKKADEAAKWRKELEARKK